MSATALPERRCDRCGARLSSYNRTTRCAGCGSLREPPVVPAEFWADEEMRDALDTWHMGRVLFAYRNHPWHGQALKQSVVGGWFGLTQTQLSRIENGRAPEELSKLIRWAKLLHIPSECLWFKMPDEPGTENQNDAVSPVTLPVVVNGQTVMLPIDTREARNRGLDELLVQITSANASGRPDRQVMPVARALQLASMNVSEGEEDSAELEQLSAAFDDARRYLDRSVIGILRGYLERSKADDGHHGPAKALPMVLGVLGTISDHVRDVKPDVRRPLLSLGAEGAEFAGWLYRDLKDHGNATYWYDRAMEWAQEASDMGMQGYVLLRKSQMAYDTRDAQRVMSFAEAAHGGPWECSRMVQAEITQQHALGLAMIGAPMGTVEKEMAAARTLLTSALEKDDRPGSDGAGLTLDTLLLRQAACYTEAGKPAIGAQQFEQVIACGTLSKRDTGFFSARRAHALALSGEPDEAAAAGLEAVRIARDTNSERTMRLLGDVLQVLKPWSGRPGTQELRQALLAAPR
jgi:transcriptional regulator with XRE-family HTH domain